MAAITRWVGYDIDEVGSIGDGRGEGCVGTRGYSIGTASVSDTFSMGSTTNRLYLSIDGDSPSASYITLYSGSNLDPRFIARDITEKMHYVARNEKSNDQRWANAVCKWENTGEYGNRFKIYSGTLGVSSTVTVASGVNTAHAVLGYSTKSETGAGVGTNNFGGTVSVSGTYYGLFDEVYKIVITNDNDYARGIGVAVKNIVYDGTFTTGGVYNYSADTTYTITIDVTNGTTMGQGTGNVPLMTWTASPSADNSSVATELLYSDHWYNVGTRGLMVKFTDAVFANGNWQVPCYEPDYTSGSNVTDPAGSAYFAYSSDRGDMGAAALTPASGTWADLGSRGVKFTFNPTSSADYLGIRDEFYVLCAGVYPGDPSNYNITSLNYGNVTVSTESTVKCVLFEIESGAVQASTVKFGLQSHGTFSHHNTGNSDTYFRFGTVGPASVAGTGAMNGIEWYPNVAAADIDSDTPPTYLYATEDNLSVVASADDSEMIGNTGLVSDPIWLNIRLGASETGANSSVNYRLYFDYS